MRMIHYLLGMKGLSSRVCATLSIYRLMEPPDFGFEAGRFCYLLTHTPDYAEDVDISNTDLALAGHTHGGQITLFGLYAPKTGSRYGQRFRTGKKENSKGIPVIITNGLGTSWMNFRLFAPSEVVLIRLHRVK